MDSIALILAIVGCLNWGLVGLFQFDLVAWLFGGPALCSAALFLLLWVWLAFGAFPSFSEGRLSWTVNKTKRQLRRAAVFVTRRPQQLSCGTGRKCTKDRPDRPR